MRHVLAVGLCAALLTGPAQAFIAQNGLVVTPTGQGAFTVPYSQSSSPRAFWCAAGDYAIRVLQLPKDTRIYRTSRPPRRSGEGMSFSLDRASAVPSGLARISGSPGLTAAYARHQCTLATERR